MNNLKIEQVSISKIKFCEYNPRKHSKEEVNQLKASINKFGICDPIILNGAPERKNIVIGGNFRLETIKEMGYKEVPVVYINIPDIEREKELNIRLNRNTGSWDWSLLASFDESFLSNIGFTSEELDQIFDVEDNPEVFDIEKELKKLDINNIEIKKGDVWQLGRSRLMCGDSTIESDMLRLMGEDKADLCLTDPPYILQYLKGKKKNGKPVEGFGFKRDRKYLETDFIPEDFTEKWMGNIHKIQKDNFSIMVYENWKNLRTIWNEMEKYWKVKNMVVWHLPNRVQGFSAKYKFFNKHDIAMLGTSSDSFNINDSQEEELLQNEYETALFGISGKPTWESYGKGKKYCPTDFIEFKAADEKSSGQGIIFGTKPIEILIPYLKVLTKRDDLVVEPFGGSGSTLVASEKMGRRCCIMEKSPIYAEVIRKRWENLTGKKAVKISSI
jgi:DNA modification methylase